MILIYVPRLLARMGRCCGMAVGVETSTAYSSHEPMPCQDGDFISIGRFAAHRSAIRHLTVVNDPPCVITTGEDACVNVHSLDGEWRNQRRGVPLGNTGSVSLDRAASIERVLGQGKRGAGVFFILALVSRCGFPFTTWVWRR